MLITRTIILLNLKRKISDTAGLLTVESLCNEDNQVKCMKKMIAASKNTSIKLHPSVKLASVLIPLVKCDRPNDEPALLYTLRSNKMRKHINQVSFPGKRQKILTHSKPNCYLTKKNTFAPRIKQVV